MEASRVALIVPVMTNFRGFTRLMASVDEAVRPFVINNWDTNHGVAKAWNVGIRDAIEQEADVAIICNDDVIFHPGTIARLVEASLDMDLVSVVASDTGQTGILEADFPDFCCFAIDPASFVDKFGWFDEHFYPAYFEDNDMAYRIKLAGGRQGLCLDAQVHHEGSATQYMDRENPVVDSPAFEKNRDYYIGKWGGRPHEETYDAPFRGLTNKTYKDT